MYTFDRTRVYPPHRQKEIRICYSNLVSKIVTTSPIGPCLPDSHARETKCQKLPS